MAVTYFLAPNARWQGRDLTGQPVQAGKLYTYEAGTETPKATYQDKNGSVPNANPVILDGKGEANIYWADNALYNISLYTSDNVLIYKQDNYPYVANAQNTPVQDNSLKYNVVRNPQFYYWSNTTSFPNIDGSGDGYTADDWYYNKTNSTSTVEILRNTFSFGQQEVPNNPVYYISYECTAIGNGSETNSNILQYYKGAGTFSNEVITISFYARCRNMGSSSLACYIIQNFGTGGSPSSLVSTIATTATLSTSWKLFNATVTVPDVTGKTIGTDGDDGFVLSLKFTSNQIAYIDICNVQLVGGDTLLDFDYRTVDDQQKVLERQISESISKTGEVIFTIGTAADRSGWHTADDSTIGNAASGATSNALFTKALFILLWNQVSNLYCPIFNSDGTVGTRGVSGEADFNANKRLMTTRLLGRVLAVGGSATLPMTFTVDTGADQLIVADSTSFYTGTPVVLTSTGTLPAGLALATTYYTVYNDATHFQLATSLANALLPTPSVVNITGSGTGIQTATISYANYSMGQYLGEATHASTIAEFAAHAHPGSSCSSPTNSNVAGGEIHVPSDNGTVAPFNLDLTIASQGGSTAHNNMPPTTFLNCLIKY